MATTARLDLSAWRNDDVWEYPVRVIGADLTAASLLMDVRLAPDTPGAALIALGKVTTPAQGVRVAGVSVVNGLPVTDLRIRIDRATMQALPYSGEVGSSTKLAYALLLAGITRLVGSFTVLAHAYGSDAAPTARGTGYGSTSLAYPNGGATLTIADRDVTELVIDGAGLLVASMAEVTDAAARAEEAAEQAQATNARASLAQISPYQSAATYAGPLTREQLRGGVLDVDLSDWPAYNPAKVYSFATVLKSATAIRFDLWEQDSPGVYTDPKIPRLSFSVPLSGYAYDPNSRAVLKLTSAAGMGVIAVVPAALPTSDAELAAMDYGRAGLDSHVFRKGYGLFARLAGEKVLTADPMTSALVGAYAPSIAYVHPADATERLGEGNPEQFQGMGQSFIATKTTVVQRVETALFSAFGTPFKGKVQLVRQTPAQVGPTNGTLIQEFEYPAAVYPDTITLVTDALFVLQPGEKLGVYATADAGYKIGMKRWDHPRTGEANPNGRVPLLFSTNGTTWSTGGVTSTFAYMQVPLRLYTNIVSRREVAEIAGQASAIIGPRVALPVKLHAVAGLEFNLYYDAIGLLPDVGEGQPPYLFDIECDIGVNTRRSFRVTPTTGQIGAHPLSVRVYDAAGGLVESVTTTIVVVPAAVPAGTAKRILVIGDSNIDDTAVSIQTLQANLTACTGTTPIFVGTHGVAPYFHEARSGQTFQYFAEGGPRYKFTVTGYPDVPFWPAQTTTGADGSGSLLLYDEKNVSGGAGYLIGVVAGQPNAGPIVEGWSGQLRVGGSNFTVTNTQILYGYSILKSGGGTGALDFGAYLTRFGLGGADVLLIDLGINDSRGAVLTDAEQLQRIARAKALCTAFLSYKPAGKVVIALPKSCASMRSIYVGAAATYAAYRLNIHRLRELLIEHFDSGKFSAAVSLCGSGLMMDRYFGYPRTTTAVAGRYVETREEHTDQLHPRAEGYRQVGDAFTGAVIAALNS